MRRVVLTALLASLILQVLLHFLPSPRATADPVGAGASVAQAAGTLPPPPPGWPTTLHIGMSDAPNGAAAMRGVAPMGFRYQYLAGGANTTNNWAGWNPDGAFVTYYVNDSIAQGITPVFTYYMIRQSAPGDAMGEVDGVGANLRNADTMRAYFANLKLFFQRAGAHASTRIVLHVEPDMWGYAQQWATGDAAATVPAKVAATGVADLAGLPDTVAGLAQAVVRLRNQYAPNVQLGYHLSVWGTGTDILYADPSDAQVDVLAARSAAFYHSFGAPFDLVFAEFSDRDARFKQYVYHDGGASWWDDGDFERNARFIGGVVALTGKRVVFWQIPYGNTRMRAMNNTWNHYQDNKVERLLDDPSRALLRRYADAGVLAFLFGAGAFGATCACDANGDGVTNPLPINGNEGMSFNADDDGGFFRQRAAAYYAAGALPLPAAGVTPPVPPTPPTPPVPPTPPAPTPSPTPTPPPAPPVTSCSPRPTFSVRATPAGRGELRVTVTAGTPAGATGNTVRAVRLGTPTNARVELAGRGLVTDGQLVQLAAGVREATLLVRRATPGSATTVPLSLTDDCGEWQTFVGGGPAAF